jgi:uroporphyrinogen-III synthase
MRKVLVTRPEPGASATAERLMRMGFKAVVASVMRIEGTGGGIPDGPFDGIVVTSANALGGLTDISEAMKSLPVFCVGERTADAARRAGFHRAESAGGDARHLLTVLVGRFQSGTRVLYLAGSVRKPDVEDELGRHGIHCETVETYHAIPEREWPSVLLAGIRDCDAVLHYSRAAVEAFLAVAGRSGFDPTGKSMHHLCLSEDVAEPLRRAGAFLIKVARTPNEDALFLLLNDAQRP